jgi:hypothetical protein
VVLTVLVVTRVFGFWGKAAAAFGSLALLGSLSTGSLQGLLITLAILLLGYRSVRNATEPVCVVQGDSEELEWRLGKETTRVPLAELEKDMPKTVFLMRDGSRAVLGEKCHDHRRVLRFVRENFSGKMVYDGLRIESVDELDRV